MANNIGLLIKQIASSKGLTQQQVGDKINRTKQGVASIYKRSTIEVELLMQISDALDYDFFTHLYETNYLSRFKAKEILHWQEQLDHLNEKNSLQEEVLRTKNDMIETQRKYITALEENKKNS